MTGWIYRSSWRWCGPAWPGPLHRLMYLYISTYIYNRARERGRLASTLLSLPPSSSRPFSSFARDHARPCRPCCAAWRGHFLPSSICLYKNSAFSALFMKTFFFFHFLFFLFCCVGVWALSRLCAQHSRHDGRFSLPYCQSSKSTISALRRFSITIPQSIAPDLLLVMIRSRETDTHFRGCIAQ